MRFYFEQYITPPMRFLTFAKASNGIRVI